MSTATAEAKSIQAESATRKASQKSESQQNSAPAAETVVKRSQKPSASGSRTTKLPKADATRATHAADTPAEPIAQAAADVETAVEAEAQASSAGDATAATPKSSSKSGASADSDNAARKHAMDALLFADNARMDKRVIRGMLHNRDNFLEEMEREGYSSTAVQRRAAELGLSDALVRQVKGVAADLAGERPGGHVPPSSLGPRTCLSCDRIFLSSGPGNRLCMRCRGGDAGLAQL